MNKFFPSEIKYCLPIIKNTKKEVLQSLKIEGYDFYEIWLDYIKDLDDKFLKEVSKKYPNKIIFLFRRKNLDKINLSLTRRAEIISILSKFKIYFDVDFLTQYEDLENIKKHEKIKLILSYHNYKETPHLDYLHNTVNKMKRYNPDILKISTLCNTEIDALKLLEFLIKLKEQKLKYIVLGMGEKGTVARIFGSIWGNEITFAPKKLAEKSAPGQLIKKELETIFNTIK